MAVDDQVLGWLEVLVAHLDGAPAHVGFVSSGFALIDEADRFIGIRRGQRIEYDRVASHNPGISSFLYRASVAQQAGPYDESLTGAEDWDMWLRILDKCDGMYVDYVLYYYRQHANSMTRTIPEKVRSASLEVLGKLRERQGGNFNLFKFYPSLRDAYSMKQARWQAAVRLSTMLIDSPFCPPAWTAELMVQALREQYSPHVQHNLVLLLARCGAWDAAQGSLAEARARMPSAELDALQEVVARRDPASLAALPVYRIADGDLLFRLGRA